MSEQLVFGTRYVEYKGTPAFLVGSVVASHQRIDFFRDRQCENTCLDISVTAYEADLVMDALCKLKQSAQQGTRYNCATLAHDLARMAVLGDSENSPPIGWEFSPVHEQDVPRLRTRMCTYRRILPHASPLGLGHWYSLLDKDSGLTLHVDGMNGPLLLSTDDSVRRMYPEAQFAHYDAIPKNQLEYLIDSVLTADCSSVETS